MDPKAVIAFHTASAYTASSASPQRSTGQVDIHTGSWQHDEEQGRMVEAVDGVTVIKHQIDTHRVALAPPLL